MQILAAANHIILQKWDNARHIPTVLRVQPDLFKFMQDFKSPSFPGMTLLEFLERQNLATSQCRRLRILPGERHDVLFDVEFTPGEKP